MKTAHNLDVEGLQGVTGWLNKVHTGMDTVVNDVHAVDLVLSIEVGIETVLNVLHNWSPGLVIVHKVSKTRSIHNRQSQTHTVLLDIGAERLNGDGLWDDVEAWSFALTRWVERGVEERVHQSGLSEARFTCPNVSDQVLAGTRLHNLPTTMTLKLNPLRTLLRCHWFGRFANPT